MARHELLAEHLESKRLELFAFGIWFAIQRKRMEQTPDANDESIGPRDPGGVGDTALVLGEDLALRIGATSAEPQL